MNNEELIDVKTLRPFRRFIYTIGELPSSYLMSMTYEEQLIWLCNYISQTVIPAINNNAGAVEELQAKYIELKEYVDQYFENLDVQEEIDNKLDEMADDGYFDDIVKLYSIPKEVFRTKLYFTKLGRLNITDYLQNNYYGMQAGCYIGNNEYVYAIIKNDELGSARLFKLDFNTGEIIDHNDIEGLFHANSCCKKDNKIFYVQAYDNENTPKNNIVEININDLSVEQIHPVDFNNLSVNETIVGIGYDEKNSKFYLITRNYFYVCDETFKVESVVLYKSASRKNPIRQGATFYKDYVYVLENSENAIVCYNRDGSLNHIIEIGQQQSGNYFGEIENVSVINDELYINSAMIHHTTDNLYIAQFFKAKLDGGGLPQTLSANFIITKNNYYTISVNKTLYNSLSYYNKFTSDGTYDKPFETIAEALENIDNERSYCIEIGDTGTYNEILDIYNKNIIIKGHNSNIGALRVFQTKLSISNAIINHSVTRGSIFGSDTYNTPLYIGCNSSVWLTGTIGYNNTQCVSDGMTYTCVIEGSTLYDGSSSSGTRQKFLSKYSGLIPLLNNANVNTTNSVDIKNNITHFSLYKDNSATHTNSVLMDLTEIPLYTNAYRGFWVAVLINNVNTDYHKFDVNNVNRRIIVEDIDNGNKWVLKATYDVANNTLRISPFKYDSGTGTYSLDTTTTWLAYYQFEI